mgnify:CR=1 FL=1
MKIIADSSCLYSPTEEKENDIQVVPVGVVINGKAYKDYVDIESNELLNQLNHGVVPTTSQPSIGEVVQIYEENQNEEVLMLSIGDGLSGTYQSVSSARNMIEHPENIHVIDTQTLAGAYHYLVKKAVQLRNEGKTIGEIIGELQKSISNSFSYVIPSDFQFLKRCGRLTPIAAQMSGLLKIVPVLTLTEDRKKITILSVKRTAKKALSAIIQSLKEKGVNENFVISICHAGAFEKAKETMLVLKESFQNACFEIHELSPSLILHGGPGCILVHATMK